MSLPLLPISYILGDFSHKYWAKPYLSSYILGQTVLVFLHFFFFACCSTRGLEERNSRDKLFLLRTHVLSSRHSPTGPFPCVAYTFHVSLCCPLPGAFPSSRCAKYSNKRRWMKLYPPPTRRKRIRAVASLRNTCACQGKTCLLWSNQRKTTCRSTAHPPLPT